MLSQLRCTASHYGTLKIVYDFNQQYYLSSNTSVCTDRLRFQIVFAQMCLQATKATCTQFK